MLKNQTRHEAGTESHGSWKDSRVTRRKTKKPGGISLPPVFFIAIIETKEGA